MADTTGVPLVLFTARWHAGTLAPLQLQLQLLLQCVYVCKCRRFTYVSLSLPLSPSSLSSSYSNDDLDAASIVATTVGPAHVGLLFKDGRVCRVGYKTSFKKSETLQNSSKRRRSAPASAAAAAPAAPLGAYRGGSADHSSIAARILRDAEAYGLLVADDDVDDGDDGDGMGGSFAALMQQARESEVARRAEQAAAAGAGAAARAGGAGAGAGAGRGMAVRRVAVRRGVPARPADAAGRAASVAAINVPAELIARVQDVLPNKSEASIRRTLQRSGLNVDAAVGELLMGEDEDDGEDDDDADGEGDGDSEEANAMAVESHDDDDDSNEEMPGLIHDPYSMAAGDGDGDGDGYGAGWGGGSGRDALEHRYMMEIEPLLASRRAAVAAAAAATAAGSTASASASSSRGSKSSAAAASLVRKRSASSPAKDAKGDAGGATAAGDEKEYTFTTVCEFAEVADGVKFTTISGMHSAMLLVTEDGKLWQWRWSEPVNMCRVHPRSATLGLNTEGSAANAADVVTMLAAAPFRASIATASGKVATVVDDCVAIPAGHARAPAERENHLGLFEHSASAFDGQLQADGGIAKLAVSSTVTAALTTSGRVFWWGLHPSSAKKTILEAHTKASKKSSKEADLFFSPGDKISLRTSPLYRPGAVGFIEVNGVPFIGDLLDSVWNMSDKSRFKIVQEGGKAPNEPKIEEWRIDNVWFLYEGAGSKVGTILKVDGLHAAVYFDEAENAVTPPTDGNDAAAASAGTAGKKAATVVPTSDMWENSRLFRTDELRPAYKVEETGGTNVDGGGSGSGESQSSGKQPAAAEVAAGPSQTAAAVSVPGFVQTNPVPIAVSCRVLDIVAGVDSVTVVQQRRQPVTKQACESSSPGTDEYEQAIYSVVAPSPHASHAFMEMEEPMSALDTRAKHLGIHKGALNSSGSQFVGTEDCTFLTYLCSGGSLLTSISGAGATDRTVINVPSVAAAACGSSSVKNGDTTVKLHVLAVVVKPARLSAYVVSKDPKGLQRMLKDASKSGESAGVLPDEVQASFASEMLDGSRNPLHVAIATLAQLQRGNSSSSSSSGGGGGGGGGGRSFMSSLSSSPFHSNTNERKAVLECLSILIEAPQLAALRIGLLSHVDEQGRTPLMAAVQAGEYEASLRLLIVALNVAAGKEDALAAVLANDAVTGSTLMHSLVAHEMTSVDFTGPNHVCQHVFECYTCGMVGDYCLSVGCARHCHRGHDVRYKGIAPTAYCDCREQGLCKAMKPRIKSDSRRNLLLQFLSVEQLVVAKNCDTETPLFTLATQLPSLVEFFSGGKAPKQKEAADEIAERTHALRLLVQSWPAVRATLLAGLLADDSSEDNVDENADLLQDSTVLLDHFTYRLVADGTSEIVALFVQTLIKAIADDDGNIAVVCRFVRSAVRVYTVLSSGKLEGTSTTAGEPQLMPGARAAAARGNGGVYIPDSPAMVHCLTVFAAFPALAIQELAENADAIIAPVRVGLVKAHAAFGAENTRMSLQESVSVHGGHFPVTDPDEVFSPFEFGKSATPSSRQVAAEAAERFAVAEALVGGSEDAATAAGGIAGGDGDGGGGVAAAAANDARMFASMSWATRQYHLKNERRMQDIGGSRHDPHSMGRYRSHHASGHHASGRGESAGGARLEDATTSMEHVCRLYARLVKVSTDIITKSTPKGSGAASAAVQNSAISMPDHRGRLMSQSVMVMEQQLERTWMWLAGALDSIEAQLLKGSHLVQQSTAVPPGPRRARQQHRREQSGRPLGQLNFREYLLSLMRGHSSEHGAFMPSIDVSATKHLAYTLDACVYYLRSQASNKVPADEQKFFVRSESIVTSGAVETSVFTTPLREALPLAERPDRLHALSSKSTLFGESTLGTAARTPPSHLALSGRLSSAIERDIVTPLLSSTPSSGGGGGGGSSSSSTEEGRISKSRRLMRNAGGVNITPSLAEFGPDMPSERWRIITSLFVQMFTADVGAERESFLVDLGGFKIREQRFRETMHELKMSLPDSSSSDIKILNLERPRLELLSATIKQLNSQFAKRKHKELPLCCREVKVSFKGEPGEGTGVARSFYAAVGKALLQEGSLPSALMCSSDVNCDGAYKVTRGAKLGPADISEIYNAAPEEKRAILLEWLTPLVNKRSAIKSKAEAASVAGWIADNVPESSVVLMLAVAAIDDAVITAGVQASRDKVGAAATSKEGAPEKQTLMQMQNAMQQAMQPRQQQLVGGGGSAKPEMVIGKDSSGGGGGGGAASPTSGKSASSSRDITADTDAAVASPAKRAKKMVSSSSSSSSSGGGGGGSKVFAPPGPAVTSLATRFATIDGEIKSLIHCPGKPGFYCPVPGKWTSFRLAWFRTVGRLMGLSVSHNDIFPITFTRPVLKYILGRKVAWHDLAFFDPILFETLRKTVAAGTSTPSTVESWDLAFAIDLPAWMGGGSVELVPGGSNVPVTSENVRKYAELYVQHLMVESIRPALDAIRSGVLDALPAAALAGLTAEDFRLLVNGCHTIDVALLEQCSDFVDETGHGGNLMEQTKRWFWELVKDMSTEEQHDLVYFWTSSPSLPATEAGFVPKPCVLVRPASDGDAGLLPTANTCISRLSLPAYPSKQILKGKLLMAIQTKTFGFV